MAAIPSSEETSLSDHEKPSQPTPHNEANTATGKPPVEDVTPPAFKPSKGFLFAFASICVVTLAAALDATSLSIALPIITDALNGTAIEAFWSGTSFLVTSAVFQPVIGGLSHVFGRKQVRISFHGTAYPADVCAFS